MCNSQWTSSCSLTIIETDQTHISLLPASPPTPPSPRPQPKLPGPKKEMCDPCVVSSFWCHWCGSYSLQSCYQYFDLCFLRVEWQANGKDSCISFSPCCLVLRKSCCLTWWNVYLWRDSMFPPFYLRSRVFSIINYRFVFIWERMLKYICLRLQSDLCSLSS